MAQETSGGVRPQPSLKLRAVPEALWRAGAYFTPANMRRRQSHHEEAGIPVPAWSLAAMTAVFADEVVLAGFKITRDPPTAEAWDAISDEVDEALVVFEANGWFDDPVGYHRPPVVPGDVTAKPVRRWETLGLRWEQLRWTSHWAPHADEPGADRWRDYERNERASAWMLRHEDDEPRHWAVLLHGTEQGRLLVDQRVFRARHLHHELGCNVVMPLLPLHATRRSLDPSGSGFPTLDVMDNIHGLAHAAYDVRSLLVWIETQDPHSMSIAGLSLGGSVAGLVAGLEGPLGAVIGLVPAVDFPDVFRRQTPRRMRNDDKFRALGDKSKRLHEVVSPLSFVPATPPERLHVLAGLHDRLLDPVSQAGRLADHWGTGSISWLDRGHVTHMGDSGLVSLMDTAIAAAPELRA